MYPTLVTTAKRPSVLLMIAILAPGLALAAAATSPPKPTPPPLHAVIGVACSGSHIAQEPEKS